jgi:hypothetical protein
MPNKKINQLDVKVAVSTDLMLVGDPVTGTSFKSTVATLPLVPYTGATATVDLGDNDLEAGSVFVEGASGTGGALRIKQFASSGANLDGYSTISTLNTGVFYFTAAATSPNFKNFVLNPSGLTDNTLRTYTLPDLSGTLALLSDITPGLTSVGLSMPSAFAVSNSPLTSNGTIAVTGAGTSAQYIRGDGQLANFPTNGGGGSSVNYYLNGSVTQGTFGGDTYYEMSKTPVLGAGTDFTRTNAQGNGYIASFITDAGDPSLLSIPGGNWNLEFYFNASSSGSTPQFYGEIYKVDASNNFTLIASASANPETISSGTIVDQYFTSIPVPQTSLLSTDRLSVRIYVIPSGRTITLHTENSNLCEVLTTFSTGLNALNGLTSQVQYFATGTSGTDFAISSATDTHTFNLPTASATNRGALSSADWSTFNGKVGGSGATGQVAYWNGTSSQTGSNNLFWDAANSRLGIGTNSPANTLHLSAYNTTNSQVRIGSLELQSFSLNNGWLGSNIFYNSGFVVRNTGRTGMFYFLDDEGQFRMTTSLAAGTVITSTDTVQLKINSLGNFALGQAISNDRNVFTGAKLVFYGSTGNLLIGTTTDGGQRLQVQGDAFIKGSGATSATSALLVQNSGGTTTLTLNNAGNLGLSVTPSAWTSYVAMELGRAGNSIFGYNGAEIGLTSNAYYNSGWKYGGTGAATLFGNSAGSFSWFNAPSGTAGNAISFTQAMTLNASGNLSIGNTNDTYKLDVSGPGRFVSNIYVNSAAYSTNYFSSLRSDGSANGILQLGNNNINYILAGNTAAGGFLAIRVNVSSENITSGSEAMRITSGGNLLVGTTVDNGSKFQVSGAATFSSSITTQSNVVLSGDLRYQSNAGFGIVSQNGSRLVEVYNGLFAVTGAGTFSSSVTAATFYTPNGGDFGWGDGSTFIDGDSSNQFIRFIINSSERARFNPSGNLLVGTTTDVASSKVTISSTTQGFLPPRMTNAQRTAISSPAVGLIVYCTDMVEGLYVYKSTGWTFVI